MGYCLVNIALVTLLYHQVIVVIITCDDHNDGFDNNIPINCSLKRSEDYCDWPKIIFMMIMILTKMLMIFRYLGWILKDDDEQNDAKICLVFFFFN